MLTDAGRSTTGDSHEPTTPGRRSGRLPVLLRVVQPRADSPPAYPLPMASLVTVPGGVVEIFDARRRTHRSVELGSFSIGACPISMTAYEAGSFDVVENSGDSRPATSVRWIDAISWCITASRSAGLAPAYSLVHGEVLWDLNSDGYRLPTEAEWVHASRAGTAGPRYGALAEIAWTALDRTEGPQPVARKQSNAFGLYDTIGNVWEWCWDRLDPARYGEYRVLKGGGWDDPEWSCRVGVRRGNAPDAVVEDVGFRTARGPVNDHNGHGWSEEADRDRAALSNPLPVGWTPLR